MEVMQIVHFDELNYGRRTYIALDSAIAEIEWLHELLKDLHVVEKLIPTMLINCGKQILILKVNNAMDNVKPSRHTKYT